MSVAAVTLAVPCRTDEPGLERTLERAWASWRAWPASATTPLEVLVCVNGDAPATSPALAAVRAFAAARGVACAAVDLDGDGPPALPSLAGSLVVAALYTTRAGKAGAWNRLRTAARGAHVVFLDADVRIAPDVVGRLLDALAARPSAVLASGRTRCAPGASAFERIMTTPYAVDWPNLSPQCYAARRDLLPAEMPADLLDPEHWLELTVGHRRIARDPAARVVVRVPGTLGDFRRQRVRLELAKLQLARQYPGLEAGGAPQPGARAALAALGLADGARAVVYLALRRACRAIARRRWRQGRIADAWTQPVTTKRWDDE